MNNIRKFFINLHHQTIKTGGNRINTGTRKMKQNNSYEVYDSCGRATGITYEAANKAEAMKLFKADRNNYQLYCYGKLVRLYGLSQDTERASYK